MPENTSYAILEDILHRHANVNAFTSDWINNLKEELFNSKFSEKADLFKKQFTEAILDESITPKIYEKITGEDFDTQDELNIWLRKIWREIYGDEQILRG